MSIERFRQLTWLIVAFSFVLFYLLTIPAYSEGTIGLNYSRAVGDANWGANCDYEKDLGMASIDLEADIQSGDIYTGDAEVGLTFDVGRIGIRLYSAGLLKGYALDEIGYDNRLGADLVVPVFANTSVSVGIFGRTGNPFAPRTALGTLTDAGFTEDTFEGMALDGIELDEGISIKPESSVNAAVKAEFDISRFEVEVKGLLELAGKGDRIHQMITDISTGGNLLGNLNWRLNGNVITQVYGDHVEYEIRNHLGLEYPF